MWDQIDPAERQNPQLLLNLGGFHGQLSNISKFLIPRSFAQSASFMESILNPGALQSALGRTEYFIMPAAVNCVGLGRFYIDGQPPYLLVAGSDGYIYYAVDPSTPPYQLNSGQRISTPSMWAASNNTFCQFGSYMFVCNGVDAPFKISSLLAVTPVGIQGPTNTAVVTDGGTGGTLSAGTYGYAATFQTATQESSPTPATNIPVVVFSVAGHFVNLTSISQPDGGSGALFINLYRQGGNNPDYNFLTQLSVGTTSYTDNIPDTAIAANPVLYSTEVYGGAQQNFRDPPLNFSMMSQSNGLLMGIRPAEDATVLSPNNFVYLSNPVMPEGWNVNNKIALGVNTGDELLTITAVGEMAVFPKFSSTWALQGSQAADFVPKNLFPSGTVSAKSVVETDQGLAYLAIDGWRLWIGEGAPLYISDRINADIQNLPLATRQGAVGAYLAFMRSAFLSFPAANITYQVNLQSGETYTWPFAFSQAIELEGAGDPYALYALRTSDQTKIDKWFTSTTGDLGNPTGAVLNWVSDRMLLGDPRFVYQLTQAEFVFDEASSDFTVTITCDNNSLAAESITVPVGRCQQKGASAYFLCQLNPNLQGTDVTISVVGSRSDVVTKVYAVLLWGNRIRARNNP